MQMALEEIAARTVADGGPALVRTFQWEPSTLSMGYGQSPETVDWDYCENTGIEVTRRQTGGGGIYHDSQGDLSYSIVVPTDAVAGELLEAYHTLCEPILGFFERLGIEAGFAEAPQEAIYEPACFLRSIHPAHDILVDGAKISGNAQYRQRDAVIQHGSILFEDATERHLSVFDHPAVDPATFRDHTTNVHAHVAMTRNEAIETLSASLRDWVDADVGSWREEELAAARSLAADKYGNREWVSEGGTNSD